MRVPSADASSVNPRRPVHDRVTMDSAWACRSPRRAPTFLPARPGSRLRSGTTLTAAGASDTRRFPRAASPFHSDPTRGHSRHLLNAMGRDRPGTRTRMVHRACIRRASGLLLGLCLFPAPRSASGQTAGETDGNPSGRPAGDDSRTPAGGREHRAGRDTRRTRLGSGHPCDRLHPTGPRLWRHTDGADRSPDRLHERKSLHGRFRLRFGT